MTEATIFRLSASINGRQVALDIPSDRVLIDLLRIDLGLTGTKESCGIGVCGACSVHVDGQLMSACLLLAAAIDRRAVTTIEGLADDQALTRLQESFLEHGGVQCGFCTPGQIMAAAALLADVASPSESEVRDWMSGNLCRCTGYRGIVDAVMAAAVRPEGTASGAPGRSQAIP